MIVRPEIAALRDNDVPQRQAQDALHTAAAQWCAQPDSTAILADFNRFTEGVCLEDCPALAALFRTGSPAAHDFAARFIRHFAAALTRNPLAHMPHRHFHDSLSSTLALARRGPATLTLLAIDGAELSRRSSPANANFWPGQTWEVFLGGAAEGEIVTRVGGGRAPSRHPVRLAPGVALTRNAAREAFILQPFVGLLVSLRLQRRDAKPTGRTEAEEVSLATGEIVHRAAGRPRDSRLELMMATLGRMGRSEAAPHCATIACSEASAALRWQALRECLALDTAIGFATLREIAQCVDDPLGPSAQALHCQLLAQYPQLAEGV